MPARIPKKERIKRKLRAAGIAIAMPLAFIGMRKASNTISRAWQQKPAIQMQQSNETAKTAINRQPNIKPNIQMQSTQSQNTAVAQTQAKQPAPKIKTAQQQTAQTQKTIPKQKPQPQETRQEKTRQTAKPGERKNYSDLRIQSGMPSISIPTINKILQGTPMQGKGALIQKLSLKYNIDPAFALAFFKQESTFGIRGAGAKNKNPGNITKIIKVKAANGKIQRKIAFQKFASLDTGTEAWFKMIAQGSHYYKAGRFTIEEIIPVYAPPTENPTNTYISNVREWAKKWTENTE